MTGRWGKNELIFLPSIFLSDCLLFFSFVLVVCLVVHRRYNHTYSHLPPSPLWSPPMQSPLKNSLSRRDFLKNTGRVAAATTLAASMVPHVHAAENNTIQVALIGCGGRGSGAAEQRHVGQERSRQAGGHGRCLRGPPQRAAIGISRGSSAIRSMCRRIANSSASTPTRRRWTASSRETSRSLPRRPAFRWVHFAYAIQKGLNVFMEKPVTVDGPTSRKMFELAEEATAKNLKVGVGLMSRHSRAMQQLAERIHGGEIGDLILLRGYRMHGPADRCARCRSPPTCPRWPTRYGASTAFSGPAAAASATSTSTSSTIAAG